MGNASAKASPGDGAGTGATDNDSAVPSSASKDSHIMSQLSSFEAHHEDEAPPTTAATASPARKRHPPPVGNGATSGSRPSPPPRRRTQSSRRRGGAPSGPPASGSAIREEQVLVNFAMSDLMAYLQVVATNSAHLPLTRRDDPDLEDRVHDLSPEDYARKSAAFVPADVRVIGGVFARYGQVWDLPTGDEYNACDAAQEPGRSYGGACTNSLLKVLYDAATETRDGDDGDTDGLFDDDDEEDDDDNDDESAWGKSFKSGFSLDKNFASQNTTTWADLLRKMAAEMRDLDYPQIPKLTTSRKIDLNKNFSLVPDSFNASTGKKRSLFIGCNYAGIPGAELRASHDDIRSMKDYVVNVHGFPETPELMTTLLDDGLHDLPTFMNIVEALKALAEESQPGDVVFVQFSGHGGRLLDVSQDADIGGYDEAIAPCDYQQAGLIRDTLIFKLLLAPMRYGVTVTILVDCCDTGMVLDLPYTWSSSIEPCQPVMNDDFSFVRFLKVVKTLYDSSTFTQLGKTVGSALNHGLLAAESELSDAIESEVVQETEKQRKNIILSQESILDALSDACRGPNRNGMCSAEPVSYHGVNNTREDVRKQSLLEQVMNCTFIVNPEEEFFSDDDTDTYKTRTEEESEVVQESFESLTEDEDFFESKRHQYRGSRSRRR